MPIMINDSLGLHKLYLYTKEILLIIIGTEHQSLLTDPLSDFWVIRKGFRIYNFL